MKYIKAINIWAYGDAVMNGQIKLQSGQWVRCGEDGPLSRFQYAQPGYIRAYHGPRAAAKYLEVVRDQKAYQARVAANRAARLAAEA